jgi:peptide deformylase
MSVLRVVKYWDRAYSSVLRRCAKEACLFRDQQQLQDLLRTAEDMECLGLAAPQVNISLRAFVMCEFLGPYNPLNHAKKLVINPQIVRASKAQGQVEESCLSIPGQSFLVPREEHIEVKYTTASGYRVTEAIAGLEARVFQHEFDHLNGILLFQRGKVVSP